VYKSYVSLIKL